MRTRRPRSARYSFFAKLGDTPAADREFATMTSPRDSRHPGAELRFSTDGVAGLDEAEAERRLRAEGPNEPPVQQGRGVLRIAGEVVKEPMFLLLIAAGTLYLLTGKLQDALMLMGFVVAVMGITIVQERRTERALDALRDLSSPQANVIRGSQARRIPGREVVRGDFLVLIEGERVPADSLVRRASVLSVDESLLTGESVPAGKRASSEAMQLDRPGGDQLASVYAGTLVTAGQALCEVVRTGVGTELGRIGAALLEVQPEATPLQRETGRVVRRLALLGLVACAVVVVAYAVTRGGTLATWKDGLLAGIAMAMAILPEEFPVILTIFLALGAWRISRRQVLTRRMPAIEALGSATVLCVDKTGTLTRNHMVLRRISAGGRNLGPDALAGDTGTACRSTLATAVLASRADAFDPMERALIEATGAGESAAHSLRLVREYPLSSELLAVTHVWEDPSGGLIAAAKGAPEAIAGLCRLSSEAHAQLADDAGELAGQGLRVLAVARAEGVSPALPPSAHGLALQLLGLVAFEDPLRDEVPAAVAECRTAGIRVVMITGDHALTAQSIARQAGIVSRDGVMTGTELDTLSDEALAARIDGVQVFARVVPEQKMRIVTALKAVGEIVAMTGDGVNDAPALKAAHIGIAMGGRGTDVAREAASLVLLDDAFVSIVAAVRLGRRIYDNIRKAIEFTLAVHVPIAGLSMVPVFLADWPLLLLPVHIVFLELIIDPACTLVFEAEDEEADVMNRPPRRPNERLFSAFTVSVALAQGMIVMLACLAVFVISRESYGADSARALTFTTMIGSFVALIMVNRSGERTALAMLRVPNSTFWWLAALAVGLLSFVLAVPVARQLLHFSSPPLWATLASGSCGAGALLLLDAVKLTEAWRRHAAGRARAAP